MFRCGWRWGLGMREGVRREDGGDLMKGLCIKQYNHRSVDKQIHKLGSLLLISKHIDMVGNPFIQSKYF